MNELQVKKLTHQINLLKSKNSDEWETPNDLFEKLNKEFSFTLDVCANNLNKKCEKYFSIEDDALKQEWHGNIWCNPPYSNVKGFVEKAYEEIKNGNCKIAVFLTFSNTDTKWFHEYVYNKAEIRFIKGRLKFKGKNKNGVIVNNPAMRPSMIFILKATL